MFKPTLVRRRTLSVLNALHPSAAPINFAHVPLTFPRALFGAAVPAYLLRFSESILTPPYPSSMGALS
jgi:hypothetical protein